MGGWECSKGMYDRSQGLGRTEGRTLGRFPRGGDAGGESGKTGGRRNRRDRRTEVRQKEHRAPRNISRALELGAGKEEEGSQ